MALRPLVEVQAGDSRWSEFAQKINHDFGGPNPRKGKKSDQAHPPIHPIKVMDSIMLNEAIEIFLRSLTYLLDRGGLSRAQLQ